ncbi:MAG: cytochrome d ubiquinol oxidase subunit II [Pseudomonadales bacterium]|jgi:cytochrome d ubiquinol oxidase subunit II|nr:cytochrome d ubiquinol oxidase subunit II [Pseudomonadales bacterium]
MDFWLPVVFAAVMALALLVYVILDGYDLGMGLLLPFATDDEKEQMLASIGPFWDANETWLVLGIGVLLIAFPEAHGIVLTALYLPVTLMLLGLVLRGIAFDFRIKGTADHKQLWNHIFTAGSTLTALAQGWMLGAYITGLSQSGLSLLFSILVALSMPALYVMLGAAWLQAKTAAPLRHKARAWASVAWLPLGVFFLLASIATPLVSPTIAAKWFDWPHFLYLAPVPLLALAAYVMLGLDLFVKEGWRWTQFTLLALLCLLSAGGLGYSLYPDVVLGQLTLHEAAAASDSLLFVLWGTLVALPCIIGYTLFVYRLFGGELGAQHYE